MRCRSVRKVQALKVDRLPAYHAEESAVRRLIDSSAYRSGGRPDRIRVPVTMELPIRIMGSGAELNPDFVDQDLMSGDRPLMAELGIDQMNGSATLVVIDHADHRLRPRLQTRRRHHRSLCIHGDSVMTGHGPGHPHPDDLRRTLHPMGDRLRTRISPIILNIREGLMSAKNNAQTCCQRIGAGGDYAAADAAVASYALLSRRRRHTLSCCRPTEASSTTFPSAIPLMAGRPTAYTRASASSWMTRPATADSMCCPASAIPPSS